MKGVSSLSYLSTKLSEEEKLNCLNVLINNGFLVYNYDSETFTNPIVLLSEYFEYERYSLRYKKEHFIINCSTNKNYLTYLIDGGAEDSNIILDVSDEYSLILKRLKFSYIDSEGGFPKELDQFVENLEIGVLFKYNYFGSEYVSKFGEDFFRSIPAKKVSELSNGYFRIDLVDNVNDNIDSEVKGRVIDYLSKLDIKAVIYNAEDHPFY